MTDSATSADITLDHTIKTRYPDLSLAEKRVAKCILSDYPSACLGPVSSIAANAGVSAPTVIRFAKTLGFSSFVALREKVLDEIAQTSRGPLGRARQSQSEPTSPQIGERLSIIMSDVAQGFEAIPQAEWDEASALLANPRNIIAVAGGRFSNAVARILALNLQLLRPNVLLLDDLEQRDKGSLLDMTRKTIFVVYDFHRYQKSVIQAAHIARQHGATIILFSDGEISPIKADASIILPTPTTSFLPLNGLSAPTLVTELLLGDVYAKLGSQSNKHLAEWELISDSETL